MNDWYPVDAVRTVHVPDGDWTCNGDGTWSKLGAPAPRLRVKRGRITGDWLWSVLDPDGMSLDFGRTTTHAEALAVGLAALEAASVEHAR